MGDLLQPIGNQPISAEETHTPNQQDRDLVSVAKGGGISFIGTVFTRGMSYVYSMILVWGLGGEYFGLLTLSLTIINFIGAIAELGLGLGIVRFGAISAKTPGRSNIHKVTMTALRISIPMGLIMLLALHASAHLIADGIFHKPELSGVIRVLAWSVPLMSVQSMLTSAIRTGKMMEYVSYVWVTQSLTAFTFACFLLAFNWGIQAVAWSFVMSHLLAAVLAVYIYLRVIPRQVDTEPLPIRQLIKFSLPLSLTRWIQFANERTEVIFLGFLPSTIYVGIYKIAWSLAGLETMLRLSLEEILAPFSSDLSHRKENKQLEALYKTTAKWSFTGALILVFIYILFGGTIMNLFDPAFTVGAGTLIILALAQLFNESTGACGTILIMCGRSDLSLLNTIVLFISSVTLDWILIPRYGLVGAAWAGALTIVLVNLLRVVEVWLILKIHPISWSFIKPIAAGLWANAVVFGLRSFVYSGTLWMDLIYGLLFIVIFFSVILLLKLDSEDLLVLGAVGRKLAGFKKISKGRT